MSSLFRRLAVLSEFDTASCSSRRPVPIQISWLVEMALQERVLVSQGVLKLAGAQHIEESDRQRVRG